MSLVEILSTVPDFIALNVAAGEIIFWILGVCVDIIYIFVVFVDFILLRYVLFNTMQI